jgi:hypothetical protein
VNCGMKVLSVFEPYVSNKKHVGEYTQLTVVPSAREKIRSFFFLIKNNFDDILST